MSLESTQKRDDVRSTLTIGQRGERPCRHVVERGTEIANPVRICFGKPELLRNGHHLPGLGRGWFIARREREHSAQSDQLYHTTTLTRIRSQVHRTSRTALILPGATRKRT